MNTKDIAMFDWAFLDKAKKRMQSADPDMRKECFAILCVEAGGYAVW